MYPQIERARTSSEEIVGNKIQTTQPAVAQIQQAAQARLWWRGSPPRILSRADGLRRNPDILKAVRAVNLLLCSELTMRSDSLLKM